jgi:copper chaperone CopZ
LLTKKNSHDVKMAGDPSKEQAAAREEVMKCEREIQSIKAALRRLGGAGNADDPNSMEIVLLKVRIIP